MTGHHNNFDQLAAQQNILSKGGGQLSEIGSAVLSQQLFRLSPPTKVSTTWLVGQGGILSATMAVEAFPVFLSFICILYQALVECG
jgi:hypothetical protein